MRLNHWWDRQDRSQALPEIAQGVPVRKSYCVICRHFAATFPEAGPGHWLRSAPQTPRRPACAASSARRSSVRRQPRGPSRLPPRRGSVRCRSPGRRHRTAKPVLAGDAAVDGGVAHQGGQRVGRGGAAAPGPITRQSCRAAAARRRAAGRCGPAGAASRRRPRRPVLAARSAPPRARPRRRLAVDRMASETAAKASRPAPSSPSSHFGSAAGSSDGRSVAAG